MDKAEFLKILATLAALYPRFQLEEATIDAYYAILADVPPELLKAAALQIGSEPGPWFPSAGDLRAAAFDLLDDCPLPGEAWEEAKRRIREDWYPGISRLQENKFSDPLVYDTVMMLGVRSIAMCDESADFSTRAKFFETYKALRSRQREAIRMLPQVREVAARLTGGERRLLGEGGE